MNNREEMQKAAQEIRRHVAALNVDLAWAERLGLRVRVQVREGSHLVLIHEGDPLKVLSIIAQEAL